MFEALRLLYHSTLGSRVIKKEKKFRGSGVFFPPSQKLVQGFDLRDEGLGFRV